jgi:hypothetical protein
MSPWRSRRNWNWRDQQRGGAQGRSSPTTPENVRNGAGGHFHDVVDPVNQLKMRRVGKVFPALTKPAAQASDLSDVSAALIAVACVRSMALIWRSARVSRSCSPRRCFVQCLYRRTNAENFIVVKVVLQPGEKGTKRDLNVGVKSARPRLVHAAKTPSTYLRFGTSWTVIIIPSFSG